MESYDVKSTSANTAVCSDICLRESEITRLIFRPMIIDNSKDPNASVNGTFIFQKKGKNDNWCDCDFFPLSRMKKGEEIKLKLKSSETLNLFNELSTLYRLHNNIGIPYGKSKYVKVNSQLTQLVNLSPVQINDFLLANQKIGDNLLSQLLTWSVSSDDPENLIKKLLKIAPDNLKKLNAAINLQTLKASIQFWENNKNNDNEEQWQVELTDSAILEHVFSLPVVLFKAKAYVGGKGFDNKGGSEIDFLLKNELTNNAVLLEIKTPMTNLLESGYRNGIHNIDSELSGAVMQVLNYKHRLQQNYINLIGSQRDIFTSFDPKCFVIIGNAEEQLDTEEKRKSFDLFRNQLSNVTVITYDELFLKIQKLISILEEPENTQGQDFGFSDFDDYPF